MVYFGKGRYCSTSKLRKQRLTSLIFTFMNIFYCKCLSSPTLTAVIMNGATSQIPSKLPHSFRLTQCPHSTLSTSAERNDARVNPELAKKAFKIRFTSTQLCFAAGVEQESGTEHSESSERNRLQDPKRACVSRRTANWSESTRITNVYLKSQSYLIDFNDSGASI